MKLEFLICLWLKRNIVCKEVREIISREKIIKMVRRGGNMLFILPVVA